MRTITRQDALKDLSKFLREMQAWCDYSGSYATEHVEVTRETIRRMRQLVDAVVDADTHDSKIRVMGDSAYAMLKGGAR